MTPVPFVSPLCFPPDAAFAFTGRLFDATTGLQNNLHRWYDPTVGRWLSEDPIGFAANDANLYRYVVNLPTTHVDPFGLEPGSGAFGWNGYTSFSFNPPTPVQVQNGEKTALVLMGFVATVPVLAEIAIPALSETFFPSTLYHFTSRAGYAGIMETGVINANPGLFGTGVYASSFSSPFLARLMGSVATEELILIAPTSVSRWPTLIPGSWRIIGPVTVDPALNPFSR
jgi:RHS repeat-associated protein